MAGETSVYPVRRGNYAEIPDQFVIEKLRAPRERQLVKWCTNTARTPRARTSIASLKDAQSDSGVCVCSCERACVDLDASDSHRSRWVRFPRTAWSLGHLAIETTSYKCQHLS